MINRKVHPEKKVGLINLSGAYYTRALMRELHTRCRPDQDNTIRGRRCCLPGQV